MMHHGTEITRTVTHQTADYDPDADEMALWHMLGIVHLHAFEDWSSGV